MPTELDILHSPHAAEIRRLIEQLRDRHSSVRQHARKLLQDYGIEIIPALFQEFQSTYQKHIHKHQIFLRIERKLRVIAVSFCGVGLLCTLLSIQSEFAFQMASIAIGVYFVNLIRILFIAQTPEILTEIIDTIVGIRDPRVFSMLFDMITLHTIYLSDNLLAAFNTMLLEITAKDWSNLSRENKLGFYELIKPHSHSESQESRRFVVTSLKVLEQYGDAEAIPCVEHIVQKCEYDLVKRAAQECLPYLEVRRDEDAIRNTLLRASQSEAGKDELLRVQTHAPDMEQQQLLRMPREE